MLDKSASTTNNPGLLVTSTIHLTDSEGELVLLTVITEWLSSQYLLFFDSRLSVCFVGHNNYMFRCWSDNNVDACDCAVPLWASTARTTAFSRSRRTARCSIYRWRALINIQLNYWTFSSVFTSSQSLYFLAVGFSALPFLSYAIVLFTLIFLASDSEWVFLSLFNIQFHFISFVFDLFFPSVNYQLV